MGRTVHLHCDCGWYTAIFLRGPAPELTVCPRHCVLSMVYSGPTTPDAFALSVLFLRQYPADMGEQLMSIGIHESFIQTVQAPLLIDTLKASIYQDSPE